MTARRLTHSPRPHLVEVDRKIADFTALRRELGALIESCAGGTVADCRMLQGLLLHDETG